MPSPIRVELKAQLTPVVAKALELLGRQIRERSGVEVRQFEEKETPDIVLDVAPGIGAEGFRIEDGAEGGVCVVGNDERGLLYGVGKLLRTSRFEEGAFALGDWRGTSVPQKPLRGMYFASHFHNFYHDAPVADVERYVEELSLWGINALHVWYDMHHFVGIKDPAAQRMIERLHAVLRAGKKVGMDAGLCLLGNEAYANSPSDLRSDPNTGRAHYRVELCPSKPKSKEIMLRWFEEEFEAFDDVGIDNIWLWPYDQGGCACEKCKPWGANGFLVMAEAVARLFRKHSPEGKVILSTWLFDYKGDEGEWSGLAKAFEKRPEWLDYILADGHDTFPAYPLTHDIPGGLPLLSFPEISMWRMFPWGGFGANPIPAHCQELWDKTGHLLSGGFPYSEGIFEDINKAIQSQFYWDPARTAVDTIKEYAAYEYSPDVAEDVARAAQILEANHAHSPQRDEQGATALRQGPDGEEHVAFSVPDKEADARECLELLQAADAKLSAHARAAWRWRILLLRALIDSELMANGGLATPACEEAFQEICGIFSAEDAEFQVMPPSAAAVKKRHGRK